MRGTRLAVLAASITVLFGGSVFAEDWFENFDTYPEGPIDGYGGWQGSACVTSHRARSEPHSLEINESDDTIRLFNGYDQGLWRMRVWQYIPADAAGGATYFILLNQWEEGGGGVTNWSTQLRIDAEAGRIVSEFEDAMLPLVTGEWVELAVLIDLEGDVQWIYYHGELLSAKSWSEGVSGGGILNIGAVDLWGNFAPYSTYYDDFALVEFPPVGACCFLDGTCEDGLLEDHCEDSGGWFRGVNTFCDTVECPVYGDCGWELTGPTVFSQTIEDNPSHCDYLPGEDEYFKVTIPFDGEWTFSLCGGAEWDTVLALGGECCGVDLGVDDDGCGDGALQSVLHFQSLSAGDYYLLLESKEPGAGGEYTLTIDTPTILECPPGGIPEDEPCGENTNGGCGMMEPAFEPILSERVVCGTAWFDGTTRDTDWYEIVLTPDHAPRYITLEVTAEFRCLCGVIEYEEGHEGSGDCSDMAGALQPWIITEEGETGVLETYIEEPGTYWLFVSPDFDNPIIECGEEEILENDYVFGVHNVGVMGDITGPDDVPDGIVNVQDLLALLADWACEGPPAWCLGDITGPEGEPDGVTDTNDLLALLAHWGHSWIGAAR
ncbi:MAG: GC-type dockerin domain-anchored protein [Planctomycetota bacterium]|nr:GC-type dockerin domain-anchored protein [Planctomycetota bacterium]